MIKELLFLSISILFFLPHLKGQYWKFVDFESVDIEKDFLCLEFISAQEGWVAGTSGTIYYTSDGGQTWEDRSIPYETRIYTIEFVNHTIGYLSTDMGIFVSFDGGTSWELINDAIVGPQFYKTIGFLDENFGWALDGHDVYKTVDGGDMWQEIYVQDGSVVNVYVYPLTEDTCFIGGSAGYLYTTFNGGESWKVDRPAFNATVTNISFFSNCYGQFSAPGQIFWTNDCGQSYSNPKQVPIGKTRMVNENEGWILNGFNGVNTLYHTYDGWDSWEKQFVGNFIELLEFHFENSELGWAIGERETILKTEDSGNTWEVNNITGPELNAVHYLDSDNKWSVGEKGLIYFKGLSNPEWIIHESPVFSDLNSVYFRDAQNGWIAGDSSVLLKTSNRGETWEVINLPISNYNLNSVFFQANMGLVCGDQGTILTTDNFGESWEPATAITNNDLIKVSITGNGDFVAIGELGTYLISQDNGNTWSPLDQFDHTSHLKSITFTSSENGYLISENGKLYKTLDGGSNWFVDFQFENIQLNDLLFTTETDGWIIGDNGVLLSSIDGGETWMQDDFNVKVDLRSISFPSTGTGYIVGEKGTFLQYLPFTVATDDIVEQEEIVISPNPVVDYVSIQIPEEKLIQSIRISDMSGRNIKELRNTNAHHIDVDLTGLAKGLYIISISYDGISVSKKMVIQ